MKWQAVGFMVALALAVGVSPARADESEPKRGDGLFERLDKDRDGKLSEDEFREGMKRFRDRDGDRRHGDHRSRFESIRERLKQADKNDDGKLSKDEAPERLKRHFDKIDANSDGQLEPEEMKAHFIAMMKKFHEARGKHDGDRRSHHRDGKCKKGDGKCEKDGKCHKSKEGKCEKGKCHKDGKCEKGKCHKDGKCKKDAGKCKDGKCKKGKKHSHHKRDGDRDKHRDGKSEIARRKTTSIAARKRLPLRSPRLPARLKNR